MEYKIGDRVRVREDLDTNKIYGDWAITNEMASFAGKAVIIVRKNSGYYSIAEDNERNPYSDEMFEGLAEYTYEDLCNAPVGTKITFENGDVFIKNEDNAWKTKRSIYRENSDLTGLKDNFGDYGKIIKIEEPSYSIVYEAKVDILDEVEKEYLGNVIKPFRDRVEFIVKVENSDGKHIEIGYDEKGYRDYINFPYLKTDTMYKGMEIDKEYRLEDLGL